MTTTETITNSIPLTAWEQVVVVCLFAVIFIGLIVILLGWFSKQQNQWQSFTKERDAFWQGWLEKANCNTTDAMSKVTEALDSVNLAIHANTTIVQGVADQLTKHDENVEDKFKDAVNVVKQTFTEPNGKSHPERRKTPRGGSVGS
jgi:hypothetical protein